MNVVKKKIEFKKVNTLLETKGREVLNKMEKK